MTERAKELELREKEIHQGYKGLEVKKIKVAEKVHKLLKVLYYI